MILFFYNHIGDDMKIYLDVIALLNFLMDFLLLITVNYTLKRNSSWKKLVLGAFLGSLTLIFLFLPCSKLFLISSPLFSYVLQVFILKTGDTRSKT